jgi:CheY-like chemotaxis protein
MGRPAADISMGIRGYRPGMDYSPSAPTDEDRANILIVDDRPDKLLVLETILQDLGQNLVVAHSGEEALKRVLEHDFAVILLDVNMPGMDGLETAAFIRGRQRTAHTPIIFVTAYADEIHTARGYSLGAVDYILAPIVPEVLRSKVKVFVQLHRMAHQIQRQAAERVVLAQEQAGRTAAEESILRFSFLAQLGEVLERSMDLDARGRELARFVVPFLGDLAALTMVGEHGQIRETQISWIDPAQPSTPCGASVGCIASPLFARTIDQVLASGRAETVEIPDGTEASLATSTPGSAEPGVIPIGFNPQRMVAFPLRARGRTHGVLLLAFGAGRKFESTDFSFANDVAGRASVLLDNASLYKEVRDADRRKNEFLAMLGHELRNPMAPIRYAVQILRKLNLEEQKRLWSLDVIDRQVKQLARLVDDLLDVSRITRGKIELKVGPVDLTQVVSTAVETSRPLIDSLRHQLSVNLPVESLRVQGDFSRLTQVLANLLNNAAKYTEPGGRIALELARCRSEAMLRVRDSGIGILPENIDRIFELFAQVDRKIDRGQGGLGVGLTLVQRLVRLHGGSIEAHSDGPGCGTEFVVRLPISEGMPASEPTVEPVDAPRQVIPFRILVVDDNVDSAEAMTASLRIEGHHADVAYDGETAIEKAKNSELDAVLLDIGLPGLSGLDVARVLRTLPQTQHALLIALSGYGQQEDRQRSLEAGLDHHLTKPVDPHTLSSLLVSLQSAKRRA